MSSPDFAWRAGGSDVLKTAGANDHGQAAVGDTTAHDSLTSVLLPSPGARIVAVSTRGVHLVVLLADGTVWVAGGGSTGALGLGTSDQGDHATLTQTSIPRVPDNGRVAVAVAAGCAYTLVLTGLQQRTHRVA